MLCLSGFELYSRWVPLTEWLNQLCYWVSLKQFHSFHLS